MLPALSKYVRHSAKPGRNAILVLACLEFVWVCADCAHARPASVSRIIVALDATPDFLLELAPMMRQWRDAQLVVASDATQACVVEYVQRYPDAEVWRLQLGRWDLKVTNRSQRSFQGDADQVLQKLRAECWPHFAMAVLADTSNRQQATLGALLAAAHGAPLYLLDCKKASSTPLPTVPSVPRILCVGRADQWPAQRIMPSAQWSFIHDADEIMDAYTKSLKVDRIEHLVVINPIDKVVGKESIEFSSLAVPYALRHNAAIWVAGTAADADKHLAAVLEKKFCQVRYVTILGDEACLSPTEVPDPAAPLAPPPAPQPTGGQSAPKTVAPELLSGVRFRQPCVYRVGRITGTTLASTSLLAANGQSCRTGSSSAAPRSWMMANVGDKNLPLLECLARSAERNCLSHGWQMAAYYGSRNGPIKAEPFVAADLIMYQGHTADFGKFTVIHQQMATIPPSLFLLQGCFTLRQPETMSLLQRGAGGAVGATSNMYSASGGAFAKVFLDTLLNHNDAGTSLMVARNYLLALSLLKERRGHFQAGKPLRAAMTFSLWGDPTWEPHAAVPSPTVVEGVHSELRGSSVDMHIPASWLEESRAGPYFADIPVDGQLAGIYTDKSALGDRRQLVPLYFAVLPIENWRGDRSPQLSSELATTEWVSLWDNRSRWLYLLVHGKTSEGRDRRRVISFKLS